MIKQSVLQGQYLRTQNKFNIKVKRITHKYFIVFILYTFKILSSGALYADNLLPQYKFSLDYVWDRIHIIP